MFYMKEGSKHNRRYMQYPDKEKNINKNLLILRLGKYSNTSQLVILQGHRGICSKEFLRLRFVSHNEEITFYLVELHKGCLEFASVYEYVWYKLLSVPTKL